MPEHNLNSLDPRDFLTLTARRDAAVEAAPAGRPGAFPANEMAEILHPRRQYFRVGKVERGEGYAVYTLLPDVGRGTKRVAPFAAGQFLSVYVNAGGKAASRPYTICSAPGEAAEGGIRLAVKTVPGGEVSGAILRDWRVGTPVETSGPLGNFTYEPLRDAPNIVGVAGGSGVTPFVALARAIARGEEDCSLTLLYGSRTRRDILFERELADLAAGCDRLRVVHVLSEETAPGCESGLITAELIKRYAPAGSYSVFFCGSEGMRAFCDREFAKLGLERKLIRHEVRGELFADAFPDYPGAPERVTVTVLARGETYTVTGESKLPLLRLLERTGANPPSACRGGECGYCRARLVSGRVFAPEETDRRRAADRKFGYIHPCCAYPLSDLTVEVYPEG